MMETIGFNGKLHCDKCKNTITINLLRLSYPYYVVASITMKASALKVTALNGKRSEMWGWATMTMDDNTSITLLDNTLGEKMGGKKEHGY